MAQGSRILSAATPGMSRLAMALAGGDGAYQQGYDQQLGLQSRLAQAMAAARSSEAMADFNTARAEDERAKTGMLQGRPALVEEMIANSAGADVPMVRAIRSFVQTGERPQVPMGPETEDGQMGVGSQQFDPGVQSRVARELQRFAPVLMSGGDIKIDDWAKALGSYRGMDLGDDVLAGRRTPADVGRAQAAVEAKPLFNSDANGAVLNLFGGALDTNNPMAQGTIAFKKEQAGAQRANAVQSYASADASRASAERTRAEMRDGANRSGQKAPTGYRWNGEVLEPIPGGPADPATKGAKLAKPPTEGQAKALIFGSRMTVADEILNDLDGKYSIGGVNALQSATNLPFGTMVAGPMVNSQMSPESRQAAQAQRDFINAVLRRESGAVISPEEFKNAAQQYFPQPGDDEQTKRNKAANRRVAIEGMKAEFGEQSAPEFERIVTQARASRKPQAAGGQKAPDSMPKFDAKLGRTVVVDY